MTTVKAVVQTTLEGVLLAEDSNVVRNVKLLGGTSVNGRDYEVDAMRDAVPLYEGVQAFLNHPKKPHDSRSYEDKIGAFENIRFDEELKGIFGDLPLNEGHPRYNQIAWDIRNAPKTGGFSHNADLRVRRDPGSARMVVEGISNVRTVDLVTNPATTAGFFESVEFDEPIGTEMADLSKITVEDLKRERSDLVSALESTMVDDKAATEAAEELASLKAELERLNAEKVQAERTASVQESIDATEIKFTDETRESLQASLESIECEDARKGLLDLIVQVATEAVVGAKDGEEQEQEATATESASTTRRPSQTRSNPPLPRGVEKTKTRSWREVVDKSFA